MFTNATILYFVTAVEYGSYTEASHHLFVSPQTVAKAIGGLEKEIGFSLLHKSTRGVSLTEEGAVFYESACHSLQAAKHLKQLASDLAKNKNSNRLSLALPVSTFRGDYIPERIINRFHRENPEFVLDVYPATNGACWSALEEGAVEAAIIGGKVAEIS
ncbi:MAG: LysR family transcriptional regulator [Coriobacteriaceae bacterium]|jgi:DNA-binding transcriptional LysR family regulator|nr:LysR family transcriptional regulator [Coriobacteriaceae bacterium]